MTDLHACFHTNNQQRFQRLLEQSRAGSSSIASLSTSGGRSWTRLSAIAALDVNARDDLGRTVLHLACASLERSALEYIRLLLGHPAINVNAQDYESHWTPLHRALYVGNVEAAYAFRLH